MTLALGPPGRTTTVSPPRRLDMDFARDDNNTSGSDAEDIGISGSRSAHVESLPTTPPCSIVSEVGEEYSKKTKKNKRFPLQEDKALDDVISRTQKCDGR